MCVLFSKVTVNKEPRAIFYCCVVRQQVVEIASVFRYGKVNLQSNNKMQFIFWGNVLNFAFLYFLNPEIQNVLVVVIYFCSFFIPPLITVGSGLFECGIIN